MKNKKMILGILLFTFLTLILSINREDIYIKKHYYLTTDDVCYALDNKELFVDNSKYWQEESDILEECLSKRKRLSYSDFNIEKFKIIEMIDLNEKQKDSIIGDYKNYKRNFVNINNESIKSIEPVRFKANITKLGEENLFTNSELITFVIIDEGEGKVIDYVTNEIIDEEIIKENSYLNNDNDKRVEE